MVEAEGSLRIRFPRNKIDFRLSKRVFQYVRHTIDLDTVHRVQGALISKIGKPRATDVMEDYDRICRCRGYREYCELHRIDYPDTVWNGTSR